MQLTSHRCSPARTASLHNQCSCCLCHPCMRHPDMHVAAGDRRHGLGAAVCVYAWERMHRRGPFTSGPPRHACCRAQWCVNEARRQARCHAQWCVSGGGRHARCHAQWCVSEAGRHACCHAQWCACSAQRTAMLHNPYHSYARPTACRPEGYHPVLGSWPARHRGSGAAELVFSVNSYGRTFSPDCRGT